MKKNKKPTRNEDDVTLGPEIPQVALANLADKLKVDLAKSTQFDPPSKTLPQQKSSKKNAKPEVQQIALPNGSHQSKDEVGSVQRGQNREQKGRACGKNSAGSERKDSHRSMEQPRPKSNASSEPRPSRSVRTTNGIEERTSAERSLLQEILALGGTEEDLELLKDIDSEEEIDESGLPGERKKKTDEKTVPTSICPADSLVAHGTSEPAKAVRAQGNISR